MKNLILIISSVILLTGYVFGQSGDDFDIRQNAQGGITITGYRGTIRQVIIPETIEGIRVTEIGAQAFYDKQLTNVTIPSSVTIIGRQAFAENQLTSIIIPNSVITIGDEAFDPNRLTSLTIGNRVTSIGENAFAGNWDWNGNTDLARPGNSLTNVVIPNNVTIIGNGAFRNNQLTSVTIPNSVTTIGRNAFLNNQLTSFILPANASFVQALPNNLVDFYISQGSKAGTYTWTGRIWTFR